MNSENKNLDGIEFRAAREHERVAFYRTMHRGFSEHFSPEEGHLEHDKAAYGPMASSMCAFDGDELVGTCTLDEYELTVPGGKTEFAGVTDVTVSPTHTRRGIMSELMRRSLIAGRDAGQHIAGLWASESNIYGRFGFGVAGVSNVAKIDTRDSRFRVTPKIDGEVRFAELTKMRQVAPVVWEKAAAKTPGMMLRRDAQWDWIFNPGRIRRIRDPKPFYVTYSEGDIYLGYAAYRIEHRDDDLHSTNLVTVVEIIAENAAAEAALWRYLLDLDLASEVVHHQHPQKSRLLWLLADPRKLSLTPYDCVSMRILNPIRSLTSRSYSAAGEVVIEVIDGFCPWTEGVYALMVDDEGAASCQRINRSPDVTMQIASLSSIYMGAMLLSEQARAGRVIEHRPGSVAQIDSMFTTSGVHSFLPDF